MAKGFAGVRDDLRELVRHVIHAVRFIAAVPPAAAPRLTVAAAPPAPPCPRSSFPAVADVEAHGKVVNLIHDGGARDKFVEFVREIVECPDSWDEFPFPLDDEFDMTRSQREHVDAMQVLVPKLGAIRMNLCPDHMSEQNFWRVYFVLLHPKLNRHESEVLSTNEIMESICIIRRNMLERINDQSQRAMRMISSEGSAFVSKHNNVPIDKRPAASSSLQTTEHHSEDQGDISRHRRIAEPQLKDKEASPSYDQTAEPHLETPSDTDISIVSARYSRREEGNFSSDKEEDGHIIVPRRYTDMRASGMGIIPSHSSEWVNLRRRYDSSSDQLKLQDKESEEETKDWLEVEEMLRHRSKEWWREIEEPGFDIV